MNGQRDGDTAPDAAIAGSQMLLRAERSGSANDRIDRITFAASDDHGANCVGSFAVGVPHSMRPGQPIADDGQFYDAVTP